MEPLIGVNFAHFAPYGSGQLNGESLLSGAFGSASLDGVSDYYSQLAYKVRSAYLTQLEQDKHCVSASRCADSVFVVMSTAE